MSLYSIVVGMTTYKKWYNLIRLIRTACDNAGISYSIEGNLADIRVGDSEGQRWRKLGAWMELLAENISAPGGEAGESFVKRATVTLTDAQIKAIPTAPVEMVPAVADKLLLPVAVFFNLNSLAGAYAAPDAMWALSWGDTFNYASGIFKAADFLTSAARGFGSVDGRGFTNVAAASTEVVTKPITGGDLPAHVNVPLLLVDEFSAETDYTDGNAANTLKVTVWYVEAGL